MRCLSRSPIKLVYIALSARCALALAAPVDGNPPPGWWHEATFYEVFVRSFADARTGSLANDGIGDLQGLIEHLDYLNDGRDGGSASLGVSALWLMPIQPSPSYHGYDVTDYFAVNPQYGDVALMKRLVAEAHRRGIRVIVDFVLNHCSSQHPLFVAAERARGSDAAARGWFRFAAVPEDVAGPWDERVWHPAGDDFYYGVFGSDMPDWNFRDPRVTAHHRKAAEFWLREIGVDGFRLDAVRYYFESGGVLQDTSETEQWLRDFTAYCHQLKPGAFIVGENTAASDEIARYIGTDSVDSAFEFNLARATVESLQLRAPGLLTATLEHVTAFNHDASDWSTFLSNHDQERISDQLHDDPALIRLAAKVLFTLPGVPFVYYGEELGMTGRKPDPELRAPMHWTTGPNAGFTAPGVMPWHAVTGDLAGTNVATESADAQSVLALYRRLIRLRTRSPALRHGRSLAIPCDDRKLYVAYRQTNDEAVVIIANFDAIAHAGPALSLDRSNLRTTWLSHEEIDSAPFAPPAVDAQGRFRAWRPFEAVPAQTLFVVRCTSPK